MQGDDKDAGPLDAGIQADGLLPVGATRRTLLKQIGAVAGASILGALLPSGIALAADPLNKKTAVTRRTTPMYAYVGSRTTRERNARGDGITVYQVDQEKGTLTQVQVVKDLVNPSFLALNKACDRLYTVHGDKTDVSAFSIDTSTGKLTFINQQSCEGKNPVHLALDPSERFLVVSNHIGGSLAVLNVAEDGSLGSMNQLLKLEGPIGPHRVEQPFSKLASLQPILSTSNFAFVA